MKNATVAVGIVLLALWAAGCSCTALGQEAVTVTGDAAEAQEKTVTAKATAPKAAAEKPKKPEEIWWEFRTNDGQKTTCYVGTVSEEVQYEGRRVRHTRDTYLIPTVFILGQVQIVETWYELDGRLIKIVRKQRANGEEKKVEAVVRKGFVDVTTSAPGEPIEGVTLEIPNGVILQATADEYLMGRMGFKPGTKQEYTVFSLNTLKLETETLTAVGHRTVRCGGQMVDALVFRQEDSDAPQPIEIVTSPEIKILYLNYGGMDAVPVPQPGAESPWGR